MSPTGSLRLKFSLRGTRAEKGAKKRKYPGAYYPETAGPVISTLSGRPRHLDYATWVICQEVEVEKLDELLSQEFVERFSLQVASFSSFEHLSG